MSEHDAGQEVLRLQGLKKRYNVGKPTEVEVLHGLDLRLQRQDFAALVGASGSGKSTLLNLIGLLDTHRRANCSCSGSRQAPWTTRAARHCAAVPSASCSSSTT
jgi:ABC-type lipoprotein export system ATPase subunit